MPQSSAQPEGWRFSLSDKKQSEIKTEGLGTALDPVQTGESDNPASVSKTTIADLISKFNPKGNGFFLKLPDGMLNEEQLASNLIRSMINGVTWLTLPRFRQMNMHSINKIRRNQSQDGISLRFRTFPYMCVARLRKECASSSRRQTRLVLTA